MNTKATPKNDEMCNTIVRVHKYTITLAHRFPLLVLVECTNFLSFQHFQYKWNVQPTQNVANRMSHSSLHSYFVCLGESKHSVYGKKNNINFWELQQKKSERVQHNETYTLVTVPSRKWQVLQQRVLHVIVR